MEAVMKTLTRLLVVVLMSLISTNAFATKELLPVGSAGEVTMNWQKFQEIWTKMQALEKKVEDLEKPEHLPPVPFALTKAAYKGTVGDSKIAMTASFELDIYELKEWVKVPFLPANIAITEAYLDGAPVGVVQDSGFHQIVLKKPGRHVLRVAFAVKAPKADEAPQFNLQIKETPMTILALEFRQPKLDVTIDPAQGVETHVIGSDRTLVTAALPPTSYVNVRWQKAVTEENAGPAKVYLDNQQLVTVSEGTLKSHWGLNYSILHKGVRELRLQVPDAWNILAVTCDGLQEWKIVSGTKGPELLIQLAYARRGALAVSVDAEKGLGEKDDVIELPRLVARDVEREQGTLGVEAKGAVELQIQTTSGLHTIDPKELPRGLWQAATQPILFAFRYSKPYTLALAVTRHPEVAVLSTTIDDANGITVLTARGQLITRIRYQVRNQLKQYLSIQLPQDAALWSAFVAGEPVKPTQAKDGSYRIPLAKSQLGDQGQQGFPVELIYFRNVPKFMPVGYRSMTLPMPDAPVSRMIWSLYLPEKYRFPHFGGDVEKGAMAQTWNAMVGSAFLESKDLNRDELKDKPESAGGKGERFRRDLQGLSNGLVSAKAMAVADQAVARQEELATDLFKENQAVPTVSGIYPVAFNLPASGQVFNFGQVMIVGQAPTVTLTYVHANIVRTIVLMLWVVLGFFLYRNRATISKALRSSMARIRTRMPERLNAQTQL
jgi:hypothetical protein